MATIAVSRAAWEERVESPASTQAETATSAPAGT